ncbi:MAG: NAD(P)-binding domain-containing protein, partial [Oscillospiraceae bacterium]|nr:NAD(P)-binding domain-containing protein [Oscillospiraceae bacterium]
MLKLGAVGCGNMASAILRGAARKMAGQFEFYGYDPDTNKTDALSNIGLTALSSGEEVAKVCDYILIAVKPQFFSDAAIGLRAAGEKNKVYISIMAGITAASIKEALGFDAKICIT